MEVLQDPARKNGYRAVVRVRDEKRGWAKQVVELYYGPRPKPRLPFPVELPPNEARKPGHRPLQPGRFWGEHDSPDREVIPSGSKPLLSWEGDVDGYAVLAIAAEGMEFVRCGDEKARQRKSRWHGPAKALEGKCLVLSRCEGRGRVRVLQRMNIADEPRTFIEIDDRAFDGVSRYRLVGHAVRSANIDALHPAPSDAAHLWGKALESERAGDAKRSAGFWIEAATKTASQEARLWAIEKFIRLQPYPGPAPQLLEALTLAGLSKQEQVQALPGRNLIFAWPPAYITGLPTRWRFLAEVDAAMEWLKRWTGKDQVVARRKRMISRFRVDKGGVALYVDFRLHIPRKEMRVPPDHGPYSHEVSHGFIGFPAISPTGQYNEGLTEVSRVAYWWFLGIDHAWQPFSYERLSGLKRHYEEGRGLDEVKGYGGAAAVYLALLQRFCRREDGSPDWLRFAELFRVARALRVEGDRWQLMERAAGRALGTEARELIETLRSP
ncbi:MAG: hypothetical protein ACYSX0_07650 [Planctomycetota bacterium]